MSKIHNFQQFFEKKKRHGQASYYKGLSEKEKDERSKCLKRKAKLAEEGKYDEIDKIKCPGDDAKSNKTSKHTKAVNKELND